MSLIKLSSLCVCASFPLQLLRESIAEHKPHIDKLLKIGPQLAELSLHEGATVTQRYTDAERRYLAIKEEVKGRATALDEAVSQSAQVHHRAFLCLDDRPGSKCCFLFHTGDSEGFDVA